MRGMWGLRNVRAVRVESLAQEWNHNMKTTRTQMSIICKVLPSFFVCLLFLFFFFTFDFVTGFLEFKISTHRLSNSI